MKKKIGYSLVVITTDKSPFTGRGHLKIARGAIKAGATMIQYREKEKTTREMINVAKEIRVLTSRAKIPLIINDRVDVALAVGADGVHLGSNDLTIKEARKILSNRFIIGASVNNLAEAKKAQKEGADYLGLGAIFDTHSKFDAGKPIGCEIISKIKKEVVIPVVAIGGIDLHNIGEVISKGADGVAIISAVANAENIARKVKEIKGMIEIASATPRNDIVRNDRVLCHCEERKRRNNLKKRLR